MNLAELAVEHVERLADGERFELVDVAPAACGEPDKKRGLLGRLKGKPKGPTHTIIAVTPVLFRFYPATWNERSRSFAPAGEPRSYPRSQVDVMVASNGAREVSFVLPNGTSEVLMVQQPDAWPRFVDE